MKKILLLAGLTFAFSMEAQCNISGNSSVKVNEISTYTLDNDNAQCSDCHLWVTVGGNSQIDGEFRKNSVKIKPNSGGRTVLSLSVLTSQGLSQCSKNIDIIDGTTSSVSNLQNSIQTAQDCDIALESFKEVKYADGVVTFFPSNTNNDYKYSWTAVYADGKQAESSEKIPQFPYTKEGSITTVKVKIVSAKCIKSLSKSYDSTYWKFF